MCVRNVKKNQTQFANLGLALFHSSELPRDLEGLLVICYEEICLANATVPDFGEVDSNDSTGETQRAVEWAKASAIVSHIYPSIVEFLHLNVA